MDPSDIRDIATLKEQVRQMQSELVTLVTVDRFAPVEKLVYGLAAIILTAFVIAIAALVLKSSA